MDEGSLGSESFATAPSFQAPRKKSGKRIIVILIVVILLLVGGYFISSSFFGSSNSITTEEPTPTPTEEVTPTEEPTPTLTEEAPTPGASETPTPKPTSNPVDKASGLDRSDLSVQVQNGSGVTGVGSKGSDFLKSLGYKIASVGNADNFNYEDVTILVKSEFSKFLSLLKADLGKQYTIGSSSATLSASSSADAVVIIGK